VNTLYVNIHKDKNKFLLQSCCSILACNCTPLYDIMQDSSYLDAIEVSEVGQQLNSLHDMIIRNNQTGFQFNPTATLKSFRIYFKYTIPIARVQILTPKSNVKQLRLSYFNQQNETIKNSNLQNWQINHISDYGRENNTLDKLCPDFKFRGVQVDLLSLDPLSPFIANNVTLKIFIRPCKGPSLCEEKNILTRNNVEKYAFLNTSCLSDISYAYENEKGDNCAITNPDVIVKFKPPNGAFISKIIVQRNHAQYPGNVQQIQAVFLNMNDSIISNEITGEPITWTSADNDPTIQGYFRNVRGFILRVLKTDNDESVKRFRLQVVGCHSLVQQATYIVTQATKSYCKFYKLFFYFRSSIKYFCFRYQLSKSN